MATQEGGFELISALAIHAAERGLLPDSAIRAGIRRACASRLAAIRSAFEQDAGAAMLKFVSDLESTPIAEAVDRANDQHYELPPEFFSLVLGPRRKYSGCEWEPGDDLAGAEYRALDTVCTRANLYDGASILEIGCGWGSLSLTMAERFPNSRILAVSNSSSQREFIENQAMDRRLQNLEVRTVDISTFEPDSRFDRVVTIEMLEHVRNYRALFNRFRDWLELDGRLFIHVFRHREFPYLFETSGVSNWIGRHFFTGGVMPSHGLFAAAQDAFDIDQDWMIDGTHYERTANAWLAQMDANKSEVLRVLVNRYGEADSQVWLHRWRMFFMACAELFGFADGSDWGVSHYLLRATPR